MAGLLFWKKEMSWALRADLKECLLHKKQFCVIYKDTCYQYRSDPEFVFELHFTEDTQLDNISHAGAGSKFFPRLKSPVFWNTKSVSSTRTERRSKIRIMEYLMLT